MRMNVFLKVAAFGLLLPAAAAPAAAQQNFFSNWPAGDSPQEVGKRLAEHFITSPHQGKGTIFYGEVGTWYGALTFAQLTGDNDLRDRLIKKFDPLMPGGAEALFRCRSGWKPRTRSISTTGSRLPTGSGSIRSPTACRTRRATGSTTCIC
jgi:hypothetical protein